jgi:exosortase/archaeosortase family protein
VTAAAQAERPWVNRRTIRGILSSVVRAAVVVAAIAAAYHYSLWTLLRQLSLGTLLACLGLVPGAVLLVAAVRAATTRGGPDIEDRTVDFIIGLPLLLTALAVMLIVPVSLSTFFWLWRLDLLTLPLFAAGAVSLVFGVRTVWRLRFPIAFLLLAWPLPYLQVPAGSLDRFGTITIAALRRLVAVIPLSRSVHAGDGSLFLVAHEGHRFPLGVPSADTGASAVLGFLLLGCALLMLPRGALPRRLLWLATGMVLAWTLNLAWILLVLAAGATWGAAAATAWLHPIGGLVVSCLAALAMTAALPLFRLQIGAPVSRPARPGAAARRGTRSLVGTGLVLVVVAAGLGAAADDTLHGFQRVARDLGPPQVSEINQQDASVPTWSLTRTDRFDWTKQYFGPDSTWIRYEYRPAPGAAAASAQGPAAPVVMDVVTTSDLGSLRTYDIAATYRFRPYQLMEARSADLGGGVTGHAAVYQQQTGDPWIGVYWEWPVVTPHGQRYERVVLHLDDPHAALPAVPVLWRPGPVRRAQLRLNDSISSSRERPVSGAQQRTRDSLVGFAYLVVSADASGWDGRSSPARPATASGSQGHLG